MTSPDGVDDELDAMMRVALTAAGQIAERRARAREAEARAAQTASEQQSRELNARLSAERAAAVAELASTERAGWWDRADPERIAHAWQSAVEWGDDGPAMADHRDRLRQEIRDRFGIDPADAGGEPGAVADQIRAWADRDAMAARAAQARERVDASAVLATDAGRTDPAAERAQATSVGADRDWDTAERRAAAAAAIDDPEIAEARTVADTHQATPPGAAVAKEGKHPTVKKVRTPRSRGGERASGR